MNNLNLSRFIDAQADDYVQALTEIRNGQKQSHWMWYIFPQLAGLGFSEMARFYAIRDINEARDYLANPVLGSRLVEISTALLHVEGRNARQIMGSPDALKLRSCMTLFSLVPGADAVFQEALDKFFAGSPDPKTLTLLGDVR